jgi:hypothetical protein
MRAAYLALTALLALPSAAIACSCMNTDDPAQLRELAEDAHRGAVALAEVEAITGYESAKNAGETVRVTRTFAGQVPANFQIERREFASGASCDDILQPGQKRLVLLFPVTGSANYRMSGLCTNLLLEKPAFREAVAARIGHAGERG